MSDDHKKRAVIDMLNPLATARHMMGGRRAGKSFAQAQMTAAILKAGGRVGLAKRDGTGIEEVVCVPGFDDGRQLPSPDSASDSGEK